MERENINVLISALSIGEEFCQLVTQALNSLYGENNEFTEQFVKLYSKGQMFLNGIIEDIYNEEAKKPDKANYYAERGNRIVAVCKKMAVKKADEKALRSYIENGQLLENAVVEVYTEKPKYEYMVSAYTIEAKRLLKHALRECGITFYYDVDADKEVSKYVSYNADNEKPFSVNI